MKGYSYPGTSPLRVDPKTPYEAVKDVGNTLTKTGQGKDVTERYKKKGNKKTKAHIAAGGKVMLMPDGSLTLKSAT